ncbi:MAG: nucleotidyl transferase AbiEii/AbiGii toxin family protein [Proteobacteria bacterium]|nr:nucleotidyl transferase AbiEii/AbiGii toxin family protein [Pseudomonadota bacterium]
MVISGIASHPELQNTWVFKGGTCLKKCYFETFRFSEDLDFTLIEESQADEKFLLDCFQKISNWIFENSGIEIPINKIHFEKYSNTAGKISIEGRIGYIGPLQRRNDPARIKIDLTSDELLVLSPLLRDIHHPYSDKSLINVKTTCYGFYELFAEKIRALRERARPRDLYDVIHLYRHVQTKIDRISLLNALREKCKFKKIEVPTSESIINHPKQQELAAESNMLSHQLPTLPPLESFLNDLPALFDWLERNSLKELDSAPILGKNIDDSWLHI